ncbi:MAG TPA: hypothetical protein VGT04_12895 [Acidobacteriaceae bacterium]|nr:hypothetical protein [Acidobacteriaceae bacterium]
MIVIVLAGILILIIVGFIVIRWRSSVRTPPGSRRFRTSGPGKVREDEPPRGTGIN